MQNVTLAVPTSLTHVFLEYSSKSPTYYVDKDLEKPITNFDYCHNIETMLPDELSRIEISNLKENSFDSISDCFNKLSLWPFSHMVDAEIVVDGKTSHSFSLLSNKLKAVYGEEMKKLNWSESLLVSYTRNDGTKIGFLLFNK